MAPNDLSRDIEALQTRIERLSGELAEIHAKVAETVVKLERRLPSAADGHSASQ